MEKNITDFFEQKISACNQERNRLQTEGYTDEANFEKIKANVYDIFKTVLSAARKQYGDEQTKIQDFFEQKLEQIPSNWRASYEKAKEFDDIETMHIESIKLDVVRDIKENILQIGREEQ